MQPKKTPMRTCLGCNAMKPKNELVRIVRGTDGTVSLDLTGKAQGRGAYICRDAECLKKVRKSRRIERTLGVTVDESVWNEMSDRLEEWN